MVNATEARTAEWSAAEIMPAPAGQRSESKAELTDLTQTNGQLSYRTRRRDSHATTGTTTTLPATTRPMRIPTQGSAAGSSHGSIRAPMLTKKSTANT